MDITHVKNAALAHELALDALESGNAAGRAYFLSQGEPVVLWDWINNLLKRLGEPTVTRSISAKTAYRGGSALEWIYRNFRLSGELAMTRFVAVELSKDHWYDISAARHDLGYTPEISTEAGVEELVEEWRKP